MRHPILLSVGGLALALAVATHAIVPAFAASSSDSENQSTQAKAANTGPYDGADFEAAKRAFE